MNSFNCSPMQAATELRELLIVVGTGGKGEPKPTPLDALHAPHPIVKTLLASQKQCQLVQVHRSRATAVLLCNPNRIFLLLRAQ